MFYSLSFILVISSEKENPSNKQRLVSVNEISREKREIEKSKSFVVTSSISVVPTVPSFYIHNKFVK